MRRASRTLSVLEGMGFDRAAASEALRRSNGDVERAVEILTSTEQSDGRLPMAAGPAHDESALATLDELLQQAAPTAAEGQQATPSTDEEQPATEVQRSDRKAVPQLPLHDPQSDNGSPGTEQQVGQPARKRRARPPAATATDLPAGRTVEPAIAATERWQWLAKAGWQGYDPAVCAHLESSFSAGLDRTQVRLGSAVYVVDFDQMVQFPEVSDRRRRKIRRCALERTTEPAAAPTAPPSLLSRKPRHRQRVVLVSSDEGSDSDDHDFDTEPARLRKEDTGSTSRDDSRRSKPNAKRKQPQKKTEKLGATRKDQPSLASFLKSAKENRKARQRGEQQLPSQRSSNWQPAALPSGGDDSEDEIDDIDPVRSRPWPPMLRPAVATAESELWTDKYAPVNIEALAVHKTGVDRVRAWMRDSLRALSASQLSARSSACSVLVLTGPPGSGKTSLVRLLAAELQCSVREWSSPVGASSWGSEEQLSAREWRDQHRVPYEGSLEPLEHFLLGAAKYGMLPGVAITSTTGSSSGVRTAGASHEIILVDELPQLSKAEHRERFHALVRSVAERTRSPVVFIISSHRTGRSTNGSMGDETTNKMYFPETLLAHPQVAQHKLLEVNKTSLEKTLRAINLAESSGRSSHGKGVSLAAIKAIVASCHGDVRAAVHSLQFESLGGGGGGRRSKSMRQPASTSTARKAAGADDHALGSRDVRLDMFRALGKILYNKRIDPSDEKSISATDAARHAATESRVRTELRRPPTKDDADSIINGYDVDWPHLCEQLQQNYIGFFTQIEEIEVAAEGLSNGSLIGCWQDDKPAREAACSMAASATVRAVRWANTVPSDATFRPFHYKSDFTRTEEQTANWRGADSYLVSSGVAGSGETTVQSRQARFELANYVQYMQNNGGLPAASASAVTASADDIDDEIDEIE